MLMKLSGGFAEFVDAAGSLPPTRRVKRIDSISVRSAGVVGQADQQLEQAVQRSEIIFDVAIQAAKDLRSQVAGTRQWDARAASVWIDQALAGPARHGALPDSKACRRHLQRRAAGSTWASTTPWPTGARPVDPWLASSMKSATRQEVQMSFAEQQVQLLGSSATTGASRLTC